MISVGDVFRNNDGYEAVVLGVAKILPKNYVKVYTVRFVESGYTTEVEAGNLRKGNFKDYGRPTVYGVGYSYPGAKGECNLLYKVWSHMLSRCYNPRDHAYKRYGGAGIRVSDHWLHFRIFEEDAKLLPNYDKWLKDPHTYTLDKDILSGESKIYSKETCMWANRLQQSWAQDRVRPIIAIAPDGRRFIYPSQGECERQLGIWAKSINKVLQGTRRTAGGFRFEYA